MTTAETVGGLLAMVTAADVVAGPSSCPSEGVVLQLTSSPLSKALPSRVAVVSATGLPDTVQA